MEKQFAAEGEEMDEEKYLDIEEAKGHPKEWIREPRTIRWIKKTFSTFLRHFKDEDNNPVYEWRINEMCTNNKQSLEVTYTHISRKFPSLALWIATNPLNIFAILNEVAMEVVKEIYPSYESIHKEIFIRIKDLPVEDKIRELRHVHLNELVKIRGVLTKRSNVFPQLKKMYFICVKCGNRLGPLYLGTNQDVKLGTCVICQSAGPYEIDNEETLYRNYQMITVQETPGTVQPGRVPRQKEVILLNDLIDIARPGDEVEITGVYTNRFDFNLNVKHGFPVFSTIIEANNVKKIAEIEMNEINEDDENEIKKLSKEKEILEKIFKSIAPSIYGHEFVKKALALTLFGGVPKDVGGKHKLRGDINMLLLGDPGCAKSQFLKYVQQIFSRSVYTTGKGASAVGLTAAVHRDPITKEWTLEGGALVLADKGICLIDEFDKMNDHDRTSIHEAMEQQTISISKAGIVTSLQARCSVIAAANPLKGRYDPQLNFHENVDLTEPILSRFDILCVVRDEIDAKYDDSLATSVINSHIKSHPDIKEEEVKGLLLPEAENLLSIHQDLLKKYILYARKKVHPKLTEVDKDKISQFYKEIRKESAAIGGFQIGVRHLESLLRMAESFARMHLRDYVRSDDVDNAIHMLLESFLLSQKYSIAKALHKKFSHFLVQKEDVNQLLLYILNRIVSDKIQYLQYIKNTVVNASDIEVTTEQLELEAKEYNIQNINSFLNSQLFKQKYTKEGRKIHPK